MTDHRSIAKYWERGASVQSIGVLRKYASYRLVSAHKLDFLRRSELHEGLRILLIFEVEKILLSMTSADSVGELEKLRLRI